MINRRFIVKNFCTVTDYNFHRRVWALNQSLLNGSDDYILYVLALDTESFNLFGQKSWKNQNIRVVSITDLLKQDAALLKCADNLPSYEALNVTSGNIPEAQRIQFIWSLSPYFTWYCLDQYNPEDILYIDADIYFFNNWKRIYDNLDKVSVGLVEHRSPYSPANGKYNVGIVYFKNDIDGYKCCTWWKNCLLFTDNEHFKTHGMCGDQKYLELFEELFDNVEAVDKYFGHLAPWNYQYHSYGGHNIVWQGQQQDLMYCHFSNFKPNFEDNTYIPAQRHGLTKISNPFIKRIYDDYFACLRSVND
tara:strand:+ start:2453 stop:3367 length:915 start_codon:yes stop_codon:yes gene_type:complete